MPINFDFYLINEVKNIRISYFSKVSNLDFKQDDTDMTGTMWLLNTVSNDYLANECLSEYSCKLLCNFFIKLCDLKNIKAESKTHKSVVLFIRNNFIYADLIEQLYKPSEILSIIGGLVELDITSYKVDLILKNNHIH
jgi:hypothetical protein